MWQTWNRRRTVRPDLGGEDRDRGHGLEARAPRSHRPTTSPWGLRSQAPPYRHVAVLVRATPVLPVMDWTTAPASGRRTPTFPWREPMTEATLPLNDPEVLNNGTPSGL